MGQELGQIVDSEALARRLAVHQTWMSRAVAERQASLNPDKSRPDVRMAGDGMLTLATDSTSWYPSQNANSFHHFGTSSEASEEALDEVLALYKLAGVPRFFVYLSPSPQSEQIVQWMLARGMTKANELSLLVRPGFPPRGAVTELTCRALTAADSAAFDLVVDADPDGRWRASTMDMVGQPGFHTLLASKNGEACSVGSLFVHDGLGVVANCRTRESFRRMGGQSLLLQERIALACEMGCDMLVSETYTFIASSYANLVMAGFQPLFTRKIYRWEAAAG